MQSTPKETIRNEATANEAAAQETSATAQTGRLIDGAATDASDLAQAQREQPDGPNVAPSPLERSAAQGELPLTGRRADDMADAPSRASSDAAGDADPSGASNRGDANEHPSS
jgi:hypothetical protein